MTNKHSMMCDLETGICGPVGESSAVIELIDLTAPKSQKVSEEELEEKNSKVNK